MRCLWYMLIRGGFVLAFLLVVAMACSGPASFQGTALDPPEVAPSFRLQDQFGHTVGLSDWAGKVVALTFLYTNCPDICPVVTETLRRTQQLLGNDASQVELVAITVDPQRDSVERAYQYSQEKGMLDRWHFLVGSEEQLSPIWWSYWLAPVSSVQGRHDGSYDDSHREGTAGPELKGGVGSTGLPSGGDYLVSHTAPVFLIDRQGYRRVLFINPSLDPDPLVHDIKLLMKDGAFK